jgi:hypothetical protein
MKGPTGGSASVELGQQVHTLGQQLQALHDRDPHQFWYLIGIVVGECLLITGIFIGVGIVVPKVKSWLAARLVAYVKRRYPNEWHLPVNRRMLGWICVLALIAIVALSIAMPATVLTVWAWPMIVGLMLLLFGAFTAGELERQLTAQVVHPFKPRAESMRLLFAILDVYRVLSPGMLRVCAWLRIIPTEYLASWPCRICGEPEESLKHGFPGPPVEPTTLEVAASKRPRRSVGTPGEATRTSEALPSHAASAL